MGRPAARIALLVLGALMAPVSSWAEAAEKVARVGLLCVANCPAPPLAARGGLTAPFLQALHDAGYVDGQSVVVEIIQ